MTDDPVDNLKLKVVSGGAIAALRHNGKAPRAIILCARVSNVEGRYGDDECKEARTNSFIDHDLSVLGLKRASLQSRALTVRCSVGARMRGLWLQDLQRLERIGLAETPGNLRSQPTSNPAPNAPLSPPPEGTKN
jgi:hypothetical protein